MASISSACHPCQRRQGGSSEGDGRGPLCRPRGRRRRRRPRSPLPGAQRKRRRYRCTCPPQPSRRTCPGEKLQRRRSRDELLRMLLMPERQGEKKKMMMKRPKLTLSIYRYSQELLQLSCQAPFHALECARGYLWKSKYKRPPPSARRACSR